MIDGFGVSGVEGVYRRCCEITLSVLRQHKGSIIRWAAWIGEEKEGQEVCAGTR